MHQPRTHGLTALGGAPTDEDSAAVELLARRLTNLKQTSGVDALRMVRTLPDGGYVVAQDMGGVFRTLTIKPPPPEPDPPFDGVATASIPMFFSGLVSQPVVPAGVGVGLRLTEMTRRRLAGYKDEGKPPKDLRLMRFAIDYHPQMGEFAVPSIGMLYSQYTAQRPTWYSGAMGEVMQIVGGYGKQNLASLPEDRWERATLTLPDKVRQTVEKQIGNVRLPGYTGMPPQSGQYQYNYKANTTHGVGFDSSGKPWLIQVSQKGVHVMPLPLIPATTTQAFREWIEDKGDTEIEAILDRFGGMPSGESFPVLEKSFEAWRRAGVIVKVCDTSAFYEHLMYATTTGWSFNSSGTEGFNTCYDYDDSTGIGYGLAFKLRLQLAPANSDGKLQPHLKPDDPIKARALDEYLGSLYRIMSDSEPEHLAVKYKLRRASVSEILERATFGGSPASELDYWNNKEMAPIASHGGNMNQVGRGNLCHPSPPRFQPQIKFPEPYAGGCISHDFSPLSGGPGAKLPDCDTIMFGYYIGDDLKVVKYFYTDRDFYQEIESDFEDCMIVGSWTRVVAEGKAALMGNFYTTDFDERKFSPTKTTTTSITGKDMGYDTKPQFAFDAPIWRPGTMWRDRYYSSETRIVETEGISAATAICVPFFCRNAILHASKDSHTGGTRIETGERRAITDPNQYRYWTFDFAMHWAGGLEVMNGRPYPVDASPVWVEMYKYVPTQCSEFADQGDWVGGLPADYTWLIHPQAKVYYMSGGGGAPPFKAYNRNTREPSKDDKALHISLMDQPEDVGVDPVNWYFTMSPDEFGEVFYMDAVKILIGGATYGNVSQYQGTLRVRWGNTSLADHTTAHNFIGVINE